MAIAQSRLTTQGQISIPAEIRRRLGIGPGAVLEWDQVGEQIVVRRAGRFTSEDIHRALFPQGLDHRELVMAVEMLLQHERLTIQNAETVSAALEHYRQKPKPGFSDCLILEVARKAGHLPLGTFDRDLSRLEGTERLP